MCSIFDPGDKLLPDVLSQIQMDELARLLTAAVDNGHGKVEIRIQKGLIRFISLTLESEYPRDTKTNMLKSY